MKNNTTIQQLGRYYGARTLAQLWRQLTDPSRRRRLTRVVSRDLRTQIVDLDAAITRYGRDKYLGCKMRHHRGIDLLLAVFEI